MTGAMGVRSTFLIVSQFSMQPILECEEISGNFLVRRT